VPLTPAQQLASFIAKFAPAQQRLIRALRASVRRRLPGANELVYDNYNFLVIAYGPTEKPSECYFSLGANKHGVSLFFGYNGAKLADPQRLLQGKGALNRFVRLESERTLTSPGVKALVSAAVLLGKPTTDGKGKLFILSISAKQRPRR
jgi:hypothetical protein